MRGKNVNGGKNIGISLMNHVEILATRSNGAALYGALTLHHTFTDVTIKDTC